MAATKILVVEDELIVALDLRNSLRSMGYDVVATAYSGEEAIQEAAEKTPDLVLMDIRLRGSLDGVEAARQISTNFDIPIIYLTASADKATIERVKTTQPLGYLIKPFKQKDLNTTIEITLARYTTERKLKQSKQWLTTVLKSIGDGVITSDEKAAVNFINPVAEILTGWKQEDALGKEVTEVFNIVKEETRTVVENPVIKALQEDITVGIPEQTILIARNGTELPIADTATPIKDDKGNITGAVLVFRDITERKRAEEARQKQIGQERLVAEMEKINQLKDEFLNTVSHELRTPITNMKMAIEMLKSMGGLHGRGLRYLEILQAECIRESDLIDSLLDLQRLESALNPVLLVESWSLQKWLPSMVEPFRSRIEQRQLTLQINLPAEPTTLVSNRACLERVLTELLNNACKYTPPGGVIVLSVTPIPSPTFTISNSVEIPAAGLPHLFEKFYRVPNGDRWQQGGTGLGLALVQNLVQQLQATIQVESREGWTTFTIQLPTNAIASGNQT